MAEMDFSEPSPALELIKQCCICMRKDRKLLHLCLVNGGGNGLFSLLCDDQNDSPDGNKEPTRLIICWECDAIMSKIVHFRQQACKAQKRLSSIAEGRSMAQNTFVLIFSLTVRMRHCRRRAKALDTTPRYWSCWKAYTNNHHQENRRKTENMKSMSTKNKLHGIESI